MMGPYYADESVTLYYGDCLDVLRELPDSSVDSVVTDPPYGLEFMGRDWVAPWRDSGVNADAGMSEVGYTDGGKRLPRPTFTGSTNPKCRVCKGNRRGRRDGTAKVAVCLCADGGHFPNVRAVEMRAFQDWCEAWVVECLRILKPGGHLVAFGGSRTWHRLAVAVEDAGFEIRDSIAWLYGSGFPKSMNVAKAIATGGRPEDMRRAAMGDEYSPSGRGRVNYDHGGASVMNGSSSEVPLTPEAEGWQGWGTALKPAFEPIVVGRKPLAGTVAQNVLTHGTGALNIDACRTATATADDYGRSTTRADGSRSTSRGVFGVDTRTDPTAAHDRGRWPTNVVLDDSQAAALDEQSGDRTGMKPGVLRRGATTGRSIGGDSAYGTAEPQDAVTGYGDSGGASRFFPTFRYEAKAPASERPNVDGVQHPTVKPLDLMRWLVRLVTPPNGVVLEPFAGSGTTAEACVLEHMRCIAIEREADYLPLITSRLTKPMQVGFDFGSA